MFFRYYFFHKITDNGRGFTQGGEGLFLLLAWPLKTRLAESQITEVDLKLQS